MSADALHHPRRLAISSMRRNRSEARRRMLWILLRWSWCWPWPCWWDGCPIYKRNKEVNARAQQQKNALPVVEVQTVHAASSEQELTLPGTVTPLAAAHIYARATGIFEGPLCGPGRYGAQGAVTGGDLGARPGRLGRAAGGSCAAEQRQRADGAIHAAAAAGDL